MHDEPLRFLNTGGPALAQAMVALSGEVSGLRREVRDVREAIGQLRDDLAQERQRASARHEQHIVLRTQMKVLWAVAGIAGASALAALVLDLVRLVKGATP